MVARWGEGSGKAEFYSLRVISELAPQTSILAFHDLPLSSSGFSSRLFLWIDQTQDLVVKSDFELTGKLENSRDVSLRVEQVFGDYDSAIIVKRPAGVLTGT